MFFSPAKCAVPAGRDVRIMFEHISRHPGASYLDGMNRGNLNQPGNTTGYVQISGGGDSFLQMEATKGILEWGLTANGTDDVLWSLNTTVYPSFINLGQNGEVTQVKLTAFVRAVQVVGGGVFGAAIGQNIAFDTYKKHAYWRWQNTNGGTLFGQYGTDQDTTSEHEFLQGVLNEWLKLELTVKQDGTTIWKVTKLSDETVAEWAPAEKHTSEEIMNLLGTAVGGGPQKFECAYWRLDYD